MTVSLKHKFQSAKSDGSDPSLIQPSSWNAEHTLICGSGVVLGRSSAGTGAVEEIACTTLARTLISRTDAADILNDLGINAVIEAAFPAGMIMPFATPTAPTGWLACDGSAVSRTTYSRLFDKIGTSWGPGDASTTFNVPDFRGAFLRGFDNQRGYDPNRTFASYQADDYPTHTHSLTDPGHTHVYTAGGAASGLVGSGGNPMGVSISAPQGGSVTSSVGTGITIGNAGGASEVRPKNYAVLYCIRT